MTPSGPNECALSCPICDLSLLRSGSTLGCASGHSFDVAREGYVNLLVSQHKRRGIEGDATEMLQARRRFLDAGHYEPLLEEIVSQTEAVLVDRAGGSPACVVEVGCGEGYFIGGVSERIGSPMRTSFFGMDLSKRAIKHAARRYGDVAFFVADVHRKICMPTGSVGCLLDVFAPRNPSEFARVLAPTGSAIVVIPGPTHLQSLRAQLGLIDIEPDKERRLVDRFAELFSVRERTEIRYQLRLGPQEVADLVEMGPNYWHEHAAHIDESATTEASFVVLRFVRLASLGAVDGESSERSTS